MKKLYFILIMLILFSIAFAGGVNGESNSPVILMEDDNADINTNQQSNTNVFVLKEDDGNIQETSIPTNTPFITEGEFRAKFDIEKTVATIDVPFKIFWDIQGGIPPYKLEVNALGQYRDELFSDIPNKYIKMCDTFTSNTPSGNEELILEYQGPRCLIIFKVTDSVGNTINKEIEFAAIENVVLLGTAGQNSIKLKRHCTPLSINDQLFQYIDGRFVKVNKERTYDENNWSNVEITGLQPNTKHYFLVQNKDEAGVTELNTALLKEFTTLPLENISVTETNETVNNGCINKYLEKFGLNVYVEVNKTSVKVGDKLNAKWYIDGDDSQYGADILWYGIYTIDTDTEYNGLSGESSFTVKPGMGKNVGFKLQIWEEDDYFSNEEIIMEVVNEDGWQWEGDSTKIILCGDRFAYDRSISAIIYKEYDIPTGTYIFFDYQWGIIDDNGNINYGQINKVERPGYETKVSFKPTTGKKGILKVIAYEYSGDPYTLPSKEYFSDTFIISGDDEPEESANQVFVLQEDNQH